MISFDHTSVRGINSPGIGDWLDDLVGTTWTYNDPSHTFQVAELNFLSSIPTQSSNKITPGVFNWFRFKDASHINSSNFPSNYSRCSNNEVFYVSGAPDYCANPNTIIACKNSPVTFKYFSNYEPGVKCDWDFGDNISGSLRPNEDPADQTYTYIHSGLYTVSCTLKFGGGNNCKYIFQRQIRIYGADITSVPNPAVICSGNSITLTATGGSSYSWDHGGSSTNPLVVSPSGSITYTVTASGVNGCNANATVSIIVDQAPTTANVKTDISCHGANNGSIDFNSTGGITPFEYSINNGTTWQTSDVFSNLSAATYPCLIRSANGCTSAISITIVEPNVLTFNINSSTSQLSSCNGTVTTTVIGGTSPYTFIWNGNPNNNLLSYSNLCPGTYTIVVTDNNGCIASATTSFTSLTDICSITGVQLNIVSGETSSFINNFNLYSTGDKVVIHGNFIVDEDFDFNTSQVYIAPGVSILVSPGSSANHNIFRVLNQSVLQACSDPWQSIVMTNSFTDLIFDGSTFRDALEAVDASNSTDMEITKNQFLHNLISIHIHSGSYTGSHIYSNTFNYQNATFDSPKAEVHIKIENSADLTIGGTTSVASDNYFFNAKYGITADGPSSVIILNNIFHDIGYHYIDDALVQRTGGAAIRINGPIANQSTSTYLWVGFGTPNSLNEFYNMEATCIHTEDQVNSYIAGNLFNNIGYGFTAYATKTSYVTVDGNEFKNFDTGIQIYNTIHDNSGSTSNGLVLIQNNRFNMTSTSFNPNFSVPMDYTVQNKYGVLAIDIDNPISVGSLVEIYSNWIANTKYGIHTRNLQSYDGVGNV